MSQKHKRTDTAVKYSVFTLGWVAYSLETNNRIGWTLTDWFWNASNSTFLPELTHWPGKWSRQQTPKHAGLFLHVRFRASDLHGNIISVTFALFCTTETQVRRINVSVTAFLNTMSVSNPGNALDRIFKRCGGRLHKCPSLFQELKVHFFTQPKNHCSSNCIFCISYTPIIQDLT